MRSQQFLVACGVLPTLAACSFLLDYGSLQGGTKPSANAGAGDNAAGEAGAPSSGNGGSNTAGSSNGGSAGEGGSAGACTPDSCNDDDPCTTDSCDATSADGCAHSFVPGLGLEQDWPPILADTQYRVTLTAGSDAFYFSTFSQTAKKNEVEIFRLGQNDAAYTSLKKLSAYPAFAGGPVSAAGLAVDSSAVLGESLQGLVAIKSATGDAQVWQLSMTTKGAFAVPKKVGDSYSQALVFNYPVERALAGTVHGAWLNADGSISLLSPGADLPAAFGSPLNPAGTLALVGTDDNKPAVIYSGKTSGVYVQTSGHLPVPMLECQATAGGYLSMGATALAGHNGVWFAVWTKYATDILTTESHALLCSNGTCIPDTSTQCNAADSNNLQRNWATESVHLQGDPADQSYFVVIAPSLGADAGSGTTTAAIAASLTRLTSPLETGSASKLIGKPVTLASQTALAPDFRGPDFPAVSILPGAQTKVAVAWIQPPAAGSKSDQLRLQRYRMCIPKQ